MDRMEHSIRERAIVAGSPPRTTGRAHRTSRAAFGVILLGGVLLGASGAAAPPSQPPATPGGRPFSVQHNAALPRDSVVRLGPGVYRVGSVTIDAQQRAVSMPGRVNMQSGAVELLACARYGKTHESVFAMDAEPYHIQVGLLLLGLEQTRKPLRFQGDPAQPTGDSVIVTVAWTDSAGKHVEVRGEDAVMDMRTHRPMPHTPWVFVGSRIHDGVFDAQVEGNIVTTYHDPATIIDNPLDGGADDTVYVVNTALVPPVGTPVTLTLRPAGPPPEASRRQEKQP